jgi:hypothetical protein
MGGNVPVTRIGTQADGMVAGQSAGRRRGFCRAFRSKDGAPA